MIDYVYADACDVSARGGGEEDRGAAGGDGASETGSSGKNHSLSSFKAFLKSIYIKLLIT